MIENIEIGTKFFSEPRMMTRERMRWYCDALETTALGTGEFVIAEPTIHTDEEYAKAQGLPGIIADGMISTNYISSLLYRHFGVKYLESVELSTKFIRPVYEDDILSAHAEVTNIEDGQWHLDVWVEKEDGSKATVGYAKISQ